MKSANQRLFDLQVEHLLVVRRYEESMKRLLEEAGGRHRTLLQKLLRKDPKDSVGLRKEVERYVGELYTTANNGLTDYLGAELDFQTNSIRKVAGDFYKVKSINRGELAKEFTKSPLTLNGQSYNRLSKSFEGLSKQEYTRVSLSIRKGIADGLDEKALINQAMKATSLTETQAKTLVVTNMAHAESMVKEKVAEANSDLISGLIFTAILDTRTSKICSSYDGLFQSIKNVKIRPPLHYNCRSKLVPMIKSKEQLIANGLNLDSVEPGYLSGEVPLKETFADWLRRQTTADQAKHLGSEEKAALFQNGALDIKDFFSAKGNPVSIAVLRKLDNLATHFTPVWQRDRASRPTLQSVDRPHKLLQSPQLRKNLEDLYIEDSINGSQALSLVDYRGTTLAGKRASRHRANNVMDERNTSFDPFTGEVKSTLTYDPDFILLQERIDYMKASKALDQRQKSFIEEFVNGLEDKVSVNQQIAITENLRIVFERYEKNKVPWDDFTKVLRAEMNYSSINASQLLDTRSRARSELFLKFRGDPKEPAVMIGADKVTLAELSANKLQYERYVNTWSTTKGRGLARKLYYTAKSPWRTYFFKPDKGPSSLSEKLWDSFIKRSIRNTFYKNDPVGFYTRYGKTPPAVKKVLIEWAKKKFYPKWIKAVKAVKEEGIQDWITRNVREQYRSIIDLEFSKNNKLPILFEKELSKNLKDVEGNVVATLANLLKVVGDGQTTDYDSLAILLGKELRKKWPPIIPFMGSSLSDYHREGSEILEYLRKQKVIRVNSRGVTRRSTIDLDTGRSSGNFKDTVSREVQILDKDMLELQKNNRALELSNRIGVDRDRNKYYVVPFKKNYVDARGNDTGVPVITKSANANFDEKQLDGDFADMLNHTMSFRYETDPEFSSFMDDVARFRDPRGRTEYYDSINAFREEIIRRGDQGYGLLETIRYYNNTGNPFTVIARIDGRGRVYYNGYLTPTGGEVVRPFLNSATAKPMTPQGLHQIKIQMGSVIGPSAEALTDAGRLAIFKRNEKAILEVGEILSAKTQRDRRIREFLEHPLILSTDGEEVAKIARFSLEYYRLWKHTGGDFSSGYNKTIFGEKHGQWKDTQRLVEEFNPKVVYHEFYEEPETIAWAKSKGYILRPFDLPYVVKDRIKNKEGEAAMHLARENFMKKQLEAAPWSEKTAFVAGEDHVFHKKSLLSKLDYRKVNSDNKIFEKSNDKLATFKTKLIGESDASASGLQMVALATGDRGAAITSNVLQSRQKNRIYDLVAMDTVADPRFQELIDELGVPISFEDLAKASKYQVMIALYGAGKTGQAARVAAELQKVLEKRDILVITRKDYLATAKVIDKKIKEAKDLGADETAADLAAFKRELNELSNNPDVFAGRDMIAEAMEIHPDVAAFVMKFTANRSKVGPEAFKRIAAIMSEKLQERAPVTDNFIDFYKRLAQDYARTTKKVRIPWVTFDGKVLWQDYRPKIQQEIRFYDPESRRYVRNIYQMDAEDGKLLGKNVGDVRLGFGVNGGMCAILKQG